MNLLMLTLHSRTHTTVCQFLSSHEEEEPRVTQNPGERERSEAHEWNTPRTAVLGSKRTHAEPAYSGA